MMRAGLVSAALLAALALAPREGAAGGLYCNAAPEPVLALEFASRYADTSPSRSEIDPEGDAQMLASLAPVDDFLREVTDAANAALAREAGGRMAARCAAGWLATWAEADALADLRSESARLVAGARLAGLALALVQLRQVLGPTEEIDRASRWLTRRVEEQMLYWDSEAPDGARRGNLRAWAALAAIATAELTGDPVMRGWGAFSAARVLCTANADGSLPQEMRRGARSLHYQLHALAPLAASAAILARRGMPIHQRCNRALVRAARFALMDLADGRKSHEWSGHAQTLARGEQQLEAHQLAWIEPYLTVVDDPVARRIAEVLRPLKFSKLGGDQTLIWHPGRE